MQMCKFTNRNFFLSSGASLRASCAAICSVYIWGYKNRVVILNILRATGCDEAISKWDEFLVTARWKLNFLCWIFKCLKILKILNKICLHLKFKGNETMFFKQLNFKNRFWTSKKKHAKTIKQISLQNTFQLP